MAVPRRSMPTAPKNQKKPPTIMVTTIICQKTARIEFRHPDAEDDAEDGEEDDQHRLDHADSHPLQALRGRLAGQGQKWAAGDERADAVEQRGEDGIGPTQWVNGRRPAG